MRNDSEIELPPGQQLAAPTKWPVVGERAPKKIDEPWTVTITGRVAKPLHWTVDELRAMPQVEQVTDVHCVTRWTKLGMRFRGVPLRLLLEKAHVVDDARYISFVARSERDHSTSMVLADALELNTLIAFEADGEPLSEIHGGPVRVVVPGRYFYKSLKWLARIELLRDDRLGFWEATAGYHNEADPLREQRYMAPTLTKQDAARLIAARDFSNRDLRSIDAAGRKLAGLNARGALLRDANFRGSNLTGACFDEANLSNAHLEQADLRNATFRHADVEGANFTAADLRGADFRGASLFGASFCDEQSTSAALLDHTTRIDPTALDQLTPKQFAFLRQALR